MSADQIGNLTACDFSNVPITYLTILQRIITPILFGIIVTVGFIGNMLVIIVIIANTQMRNTTNILIFSLAMADLAFIVFCVPFTAVVYASNGWPMGSIMCKIYTFMIYFTAYCSVYTLVLMSVDRFLAVVFPIESKPLRTARHTQIVVLLTWFIFIVVHIPLLVYSEVIVAPPVTGYNCVTSFCSYTKLMEYNETTGRPTGNVNREQGRIYFTLFFIFGFLLPLGVIIVLYSILICVLLFGRTSKISHSSEAMRSKRRVTRMVVIVVIIFACCWMPIQVIFLVQYYNKDLHSGVFRTFHVISNCLAYSNSSVNPILYAFLSENFRRAFARLLCFKPLRPQEIDRLEMQTENGRTTRPLISTNVTQMTQAQTAKVQ